MNKLTSLLLSGLLFLLPLALISDTYKYNPFTEELDILGTGPGGGAGITVSAGSGIAIVPTGDDREISILDSFTATRPHIQAGTDNYCDATGSASAQTCVLAYTLAAYTEGMKIVYVPNTTNVTTQTVAINGLSATSILKNAGTALAAGDLTATYPKLLIYDGTAFRISAPDSAAGGQTIVRKCYVPGLTNTTNSSTLLATATMTVSAGDIIRVTALLHTLGTDISRWTVNLGSTVVIPLWSVGVGGEEILGQVTISVTSATEYYASMIGTRPGGTNNQIAGSAGTGGTYTGSQTVDIFGSFSAPTGSTASIKNFCVEQLPATP